MSKQRPETDSRRRLSARLHSTLERNLLSYAAAASAAGVALLAMAPPVAAEIIFTPAHFPLINGSRLDLNNDGTTDFTFFNHRSMHRSATSLRRFSYGLLSVLPVGAGNQVFGGSYASALKAGSVIGSSGKFPGGNRMLHVVDRDGLSTYQYEYGPWHVTPFRTIHRFLGLKFITNGEIHFGWARLSVFVVSGAYISGNISGYAYETDAGRSIKAGQTQDAGPTSDRMSPPSLKPKVESQVTLGMLAVGAPGLEIWRKEEDT